MTTNNPKQPADSAPDLLGRPRVLGIKNEEEAKAYLWGGDIVEALDDVMLDLKIKLDNGEIDSTEFERKRIEIVLELPKDIAKHMAEGPDQDFPPTRHNLNFFLKGFWKVVELSEEREKENSELAFEEGVGLGAFLIVGNLREQLEAAWAEAFKDLAPEEDQADAKS